MKVAEKTWEEASKELTEAKQDLQGVEEQIAKETGHVTEQMREHLDNAQYSLQTLQTGLGNAPEAVQRELGKIQEAMAKCKDFFTPKPAPTVDVSSTESEAQGSKPDADMPQVSQKRQHQDEDPTGKQRKTDQEREGDRLEAEAAAAPAAPAAQQGQ